MSLPKWVERYEESVALSQDDFKMVMALAIAVEALEKIAKPALGGKQQQQWAKIAFTQINALGEKRE